ncbi:MAG: AAA family ATPase [Erysipelotrichaceae bacterium]|nr:AAA family ATPase [Erysipelotrichaceae bacterium]
MANLVIITGPMAVGKMIVAEELKKRTGYNLMVNHDSIEVSDKIFGFATPAQKDFNERIREAAFDTTLKYNESMIFTVAIDFDDVKEFEALNDLKKRFEASGGSFYFIELSASQKERLKRNITPNRLEKKKSKQDIEWSNRNLIKGETKHRFNSTDNEIWFENHLKISNESLSPEQVADIIMKQYELQPELKENSPGLNRIYQ